MLLINSRKNRFNKDALILCILPTLAVLIAMVGVSLWVWATARQDLTSNQEALINQHVTNIQEVLTNRMASYEEVLRGTAALMETSRNVTRQDLHAIIATYNVENRFPGVRAIGYAPIVSGDNLQTYTNLVRATDKADFGVLPAGTRDLYIPIQYIEPENEINMATVGFDMYSDTARKTAFDVAGQKGHVVITGRITPDNPSSFVSPAFQMYFPVYSNSCTGTAKQRTDCHLNGFVFASFRADELMNTILTSTPSIKDNFVLYDGTDLSQSNILFKSSSYNTNATGSVAPVNLYSRNWSLAVQVPQATLESQIGTKPNLILTAGLVLSVSASAFIYILLLQRVRALRQAKDSEVQMVKDDLLALAAHQLRTPATAVKQYIIMAAEGYGGELNKEQQKLIQKAYDNNERQLRTVNEMLYVANADAGKLRLIPRSVDLVQITREAVEEQRSACNEKHHRLKVNLPSTPLHYDADELYLRMAISNLISNAIKYTPNSGKIEVSLKTTPRSINIIVTDNGVGISKKQMPELFKKFSRLDNPLSSHAMGNGLGLYLARRVVELHKGKIKVSSQHTIGSEFTITLPRSKSTGQNDPAGSKVTSEE